MAEQPHCNLIHTSIQARVRRPHNESASKDTNPQQYLLGFPLGINPLLPVINSYRRFIEKAATGSQLAEGFEPPTL